MSSRGIDPEVCARWRLAPGQVLGDRATGTWSATRRGAAVVVKYFRFATYPGWRYPLRVAAALRSQGWPTPEPMEEPVVTSGGAWVLFHRLPGRSVRPQVGDLEHWLRVHETVRPDEGRALRACRAAAVRWFADNTPTNAARSVIHGDFAPWNLLFDDGRLTGVLDFEAAHHTFQVADFALSWRGYQDDVLRGYDEVRPLTDDEWQLVRPAFWAWLFIGVKEQLAAHYRDVSSAGVPPTLTWQVAHVRKHSALLSDKVGVPRLPLAG